MAKSSEQEWRFPKVGAPNDNVLLWRALAMFRAADSESMTVDEASIINRRIINAEKRAFKLGVTFFDEGMEILVGKMPFLRLLLRFVDGVMPTIAAIVAWAGFLLAALVVLGLHGEGDVEFSGLVPLLFGFAFLLWFLPFLLRRHAQYGFGFPSEPLESRFPEDKEFDRFLRYFQNADGPDAYVIYRSIPSRKPKSLDRRDFFGRLRYLLCSENDAERRLVIPFKSIRFRTSDVYVHRDDLNRMIADSFPKPEPEPETRPQNRKGVDSKYPYEDAIVGVLSGDKLKALRLDDLEAANLVIRKELVAWFEKHAGKDDEAPRIDYPRIKECAVKIIAILRNLYDD